MTQGRRLLRAWLDRSHLTQRALARQLGISEPYLSQVLLGNRRPKLEQLMAIETLTGVPITSWMDTRRGRADRPTSATGK